MKSLLILGTIITNKNSAKNLVTRIYSLFDGSMESSVAISNIECQLVSAGFLTWEDVELAEIAGIK